MIKIIRNMRQNNCFIRIVLFIFFVLGIQEYNNAQTVVNYSNLSNFPYSVNLSVPDILDPTFNLNKRPDNYKLFLNFNMGDSYNIGNHINSGVKYSVDIEIEIYDNSVLPAILLETKHMSINDVTPEQLWVYDFTNSPGVSSFQIKITGFSESIVNVPDIAMYESNMKLDISYNKSFKIDVRDPSLSTHTVTLIPLPRNGINKTENRVQTFSWNETLEYSFINYHVQILKLYNIDYNNVSDDQVSSVVDWDKALNIITENSNPDLLITIPEGSGFYIWRVRPIGNYYENGIANPLNWGEWSDAPADEEEVTVSLYDLNGNNNPHYFYLSDIDEDKNYIYSRTFTEGNRMHEQIIYANGLQQVKQKQINLSFEDNYKLVSQIISDYSGRPSISTLPVPVTGNLDDGYSEEFVKNSTNSLYIPENFDNDVTAINPSTMGGIINDYYSQNNSDIQSPDAEGYPYSRTLFYNDGTGRVKEQASPGKTHMLGDQGAGMGRTIRTLYSVPTREELIRVFGGEAPDENKILKITTIDPNNTKSISYIEGEKVIATCLTYDESDSDANDRLLPLGEAGVNKISINEEIEYNIELKNKLISSQRISLSQETSVSINYDLNCEEISLGCLNIEPNCGFGLVINIINVSDNTLFDSMNMPDACNWAGDWIVTLPTGNYRIVKELIINNDVEQSIQVTLNESDEVMRPLVDLISAWLDTVYNENDFIEFYETINIYNYDFSSMNLVDFNAKYLFPEDFIPQSQITLYPAYNPGTPEITPYKLSFEGCCGTVEVPLKPFPESDFVCYTRSELIADPSLSPNFAGYLNDVIQGSSVSWNDIMPGYGPYDPSSPSTNVFNQMIYHMLTDEYDYAGSGIEVQYDCADLWKCWISVIDVLDEILALETEGAGRVAQQSDSEDEEEDDSGTHDDAFDDNMSGGNFIMEWIAKKALSKRMREDLPDPDSDDDLFEFETNLAEQFLECAGYKFVKVIIVDDNGCPPAYSYIEGPLPGDNYEGSCDGNSAVFPNIFDPIYAFKYYEYKEYSDPSCEYIFCFNGPKSADLETGEVFCPDVICIDKDYTNWTSEDRYNFWECIKTSTQLDPADNPDDDDLSDVLLNDCNDLTNGSNSDLQNLYLSLQESRQRQIDTCNATCENKRDLFTGALYQLFDENCYIINPPCPGAPIAENVVTTVDISTMVDTLVERCKQYCPKTPVNMFEYCDDETLSCVKYDFSNGTYSSVTNEVFITFRILDDCEILKKQMVDIWDIDLSIESRCPDNYNEIKDWVNIGVTECSGEEPMPNLTGSNPITMGIETSGE